jgi:phospholipase C
MAGLESIDHVILLMLENRSFDHLLGYLYPRSGDFDGLDGTESNRDPAGTAVSVYPITPEKENAYYYPLANPTEGFIATNQQLFSSATTPANGQAANDGFVTSFASESRQSRPSARPQARRSRTFFHHGHVLARDAARAQRARQGFCRL